MCPAVAWAWMWCTNIQKLNGRIDINSEVGEGTRISISLPLTLAILPVLVVRCTISRLPCRWHGARDHPDSAGQHPGSLRPSDHRGPRRILPVRSLADLLGWQPTRKPSLAC